MGRYEWWPGYVDLISRRGNQLFNRATGDAKAELNLAATPEAFFIAHDPSVIVLIRDGKGRVIAYLLHLPDGQVIPPASSVECLCLCVGKPSLQQNESFGIKLTAFSLCGIENRTQTRQAYLLPLRVIQLLPQWESLDRREVVDEGVTRQTCRVGSIGIHHIDLLIPVAHAHECNLVAVRRPASAAVGNSVVGETSLR